MSYDWLHSDNHPQSLELAAGNWLGTSLPFLFRFSWCHSKNVQTIVLLRVSGQKCSCKWRLCHVHRLPGLHPTKCKSIVICHHQPEKPYSCVFQEMYEHRNLGLHNWCDLHNYSSIRRLGWRKKPSDTRRRASKVLHNLTKTLSGSSSPCFKNGCVSTSSEHDMQSM